MAYQIQLVWLLLILTGVRSLISQWKIADVYQPLGAYNSFYDLLGSHKFVFASTQNDTSWVRAHFNVTLGESYSARKNCQFWLMGNEKAESVGMNSLKSFDGSQILFETFEKIRMGSFYVTLIFLDMNSCKMKYPLPFKFSGKNIVHKRSNSGFDVFTDDRVICKNVGDKCRVKYYENLYKVVPFQVDLVWPSLRIERTFKDSVFLICGLNSDGRYQVELHDLTNNSIHKELLSLSYVEGMQFITSDLAACWTFDPKKEHTIVHCSQFDQTGVQIFTSIVTYEKKVKLVYLYNLRPGKIVLLTRSLYWALSWEAIITIVKLDHSSISTYDHHSRIFLYCDYNVTTEVAFNVRDSGNTIEIDYSCPYSSYFNYYTIGVLNT